MHGCAASEAAWASEHRFPAFGTILMLACSQCATEYRPGLPISAGTPRSHQAIELAEKQLHGTAMLETRLETLQKEIKNLVELTAELGDTAGTAEKIRRREQEIQEARR
jgi:hypothetical protein